MSELLPHQTRVLEEAFQLEKKVEALTTFMKSNPAFSGLHVDERVRLHLQLAAMRQYAAILADRIAAFGA